MPRIISSECDSHSVYVHDYDTAELVRSATLPERVLGLALSPSQSYLAVATWGQGCHILNADDLSTVAVLNTYHTNASDFSLNGDYLAVVSRANDANLYSIGDDGVFRFIAEGKGSLRSMFSIAFSPDSRHVASGSADSFATLWSVPELAKLRTFACQSSTDEINFVIFLSDLKLATCSDDAVLRVCDIEAGQCLSELTYHTSAVRHAAVSHDRAMFASVGWDRKLNVYDASSCSLQSTLEPGRAYVNCVCFLDHRTVLFGEFGRSISAVELSSGNVVKEFQPALKKPTGIVVLRDGQGMLDPLSSVVMVIFHSSADDSAACYHMRELWWICNALQHHDSRSMRKRPSSSFIVGRVRVGARVGARVCAG